MPRRSLVHRTALLAVLLASSAFAFAPPFTSSAFYSAGRVSRLPNGLDTTRAEALEQLITSRSFQGEIIILAVGGASWFGQFALNTALQLEAVGYHHYVYIGGTAGDCERLVAALPSAACVMHPAPAPAASGAVLPTLEDLWAARYELASRLLHAGCNVLLLDADMALHADVYAPLRAPCMAQLSLALHEENSGGPNGGFAYARAGSPAAAWLLLQVSRRYTLFTAAAAAAGGRLPAPVSDQVALKDALRAASRPGVDKWDFAWSFAVCGVQEHPFWRDHPQRNVSANWRAAVGELPPEQATACGDFTLRPLHAPGGDGGGTTERWAYLPPSFARYGHFARELWSSGGSVAPWALTHMLHASGKWLPTSHAALVTPSHSSRMGYMQLYGMWEAALPGEEQTRVASTPSRPLLFLARSLVREAQGSAAATRQLVAAALAAAARGGRLLVLPQLDCDARWLEGNDTRVFVRHAAGRPDDCFVGAHSYQDCLPGTHFVFAFDPAVRARRASVLAGRPGDDVVLRKPPPPPSEEELRAPRGVAALCPDYFKAASEP